MDVPPELVPDNSCLCTTETGSDKDRICLDPSLNKCLCPGNRQLEVRAADIKSERGEISFYICETDIGVKNISINRFCGLVNLFLDSTIFRTTRCLLYTSPSPRD